MSVSRTIASERIPRNAGFVALFFCLLWILFWYRDTALAIAEIWTRSETFTHGYIVLPISLWLAWRLAPRLSNLAPRPGFWFLPLIALAAMAWLIGDLAAINALTQFALVALLALAVPTTLGAEFARILAFPLSFLFFAVPFGEFVLPWFMEWTATFTVTALQLTGIPVYREGLNFVIPSGQWSVVEACSGVRYLIASLMVGVLFAYLNYASLKRRLLFVGISIVVPIFANWLRAYLIVLLGHLSGNRLAVGVDHLIYGWIFFGVIMALMFIIGARWAEPALLIVPSEAASAPRSDHGSDRPWWLVTLLLAALTFAPHLANSFFQDTESGPQPSLALPADSLSGGWQRAATEITGWRPHFENPSADLNAAFTDGQNSVGVYVAYYRHQNYGRKLVTSTNVLLPSLDKTWLQVGRGKRQIQIDQREIYFRTATLRSNATAPNEANSSLGAWQIYWINGHLTESDALAKVHTVLSRLLGQGDDSAVIVLYARSGVTDQADLALESFAKSNLSAMVRLLESARNQR